MVKLSKYEKEILRILLKKRIWLNTTEVASLAGMSWNTAHKYLVKIYGRGWLSKKGNYWRART